MLSRPVSWRQGASRGDRHPGRRPLRSRRRSAGRHVQTVPGIRRSRPELAPKTPGDIGWHELHATDWQDALAFYQDLFGWEKFYENDMGPMGIYQIFSVAGAWTGGIMNGGAPTQHWLYYINVDDIDAGAARVAEAGGQVLHGPHVGGRRALASAPST